MPPPDLLTRVAELEAQNRTLLEENRKLRGILGFPLENAVSETLVNEISPVLPLITKYSAPEEKIALLSKAISPKQKRRFSSSAPTCGKNGQTSSSNGCRSRCRRTLPSPSSPVRRNLTTTGSRYKSV